MSLPKVCAEGWTGSVTAAEVEEDTLELASVGELVEVAELGMSEVVVGEAPRQLESGP